MLCIKFYDETKPLYIETDASGVGLGAALLQTRSNTNCHRDEVPHNTILMPIACASKSFTETEKRYSNIEEKHWVYYTALKKFPHYCFMREVRIITDHRPLIAIIKKDVGTLSQGFQ